MKIFYERSEWQDYRKTVSPELTLGFVPTMGNLHTGHLSLIKTSQDENDKTMVSLFINRMQFNHQNDYLHYPRTLDADLSLLAAQKVDYCFIPSEEEMYIDNYTYAIQESHLSRRLEGLHRAGHFAGVLTIVMKLLQLIKPNRAYFGEKDYQQFLLVRNMVRAFFVDTEIRLCPTVREQSGLAYSSRNNRLSPEQRQLAEQFAKIFHEGSSCENIHQALEKIAIAVEYIEEYQGRRFAAVKIGDIRLIDNYLLDPLLQDNE